MTASASDMTVSLDGSSDFIPDMDLINDLDLLTTGTVEVTLSDVHQELVLCNQLLALIFAVLIFLFAMQIFNFFIRLITKNITNQI